LGKRGRGRGGDSCREGRLCWGRVVLGRDCQFVKVDKGPGGRSREGVIIWNFPREGDIFNILVEGFSGRDGLLEGGIPLHGLCNNSCGGSEVGINMGGVCLSQVLCQVGDAVLSLLTEESGEREDMARSIPVAVDRHEDGLPFVSLHLENQVAEGCPIEKGAADGVI